MRPAAILAVLAAAAISPLALAEGPSSGGMIATAPGKGVAVQAVKASATVEAVDAATRTVKLKMPKGDTRTISRSATR